MTSCMVDSYVLIGSVKGLYFIDMNAPLESRKIMILIPDVRFKKIHVIPELKVLIALSGKHDHIRQYKLNSIRGKSWIKP